MAESEEPIEGTLILASEYEGADEEEVDLGGRPRKYGTPQEFDAAVDRALADHIAMNRPLTLTRLVLHMGFSCRTAMENYQKYDGFLHSINRAKTIVQTFYEDAVLLDKNAPAGRILGAMDDHYNPAKKLQPIDSPMKHEEMLGLLE